MGAAAILREMLSRGWLFCGVDLVTDGFGGGAGMAVALQAAVDVLEKIELFVAGWVGEVVAGGALTAFFCAEGRIGEDEVVVMHLLAEV